MHAIETRNLTKVYNGTPAVDDVSISVGRGQIFTLLGPNGSGKSTMVKMLTGMLELTSGEAFVLGNTVEIENIELKKEIGVLPESLALFDTLTVWEHILLSGEVYGLDRSETNYRGEQLLKYLDLWQGRDKRIKQCSFGMKKKCSLAMALLHNPKVAFLDEPFEGIDPISSKNIQEAISLSAGKGTAFFITSHSLEIMDRIIDSFAVISQGKIVYRANASDLRAENKSLEDIYFEHVRSDVSGDLEWLGQ